jgi:hypothetical protein
MLHASAIGAIKQERPCAPAISQSRRSSLVVLRAFAMLDAAPSCTAIAVSPQDPSTKGIQRVEAVKDRNISCIHR